MSEKEFTVVLKDLADPDVNMIDPYQMASVLQTCYDGKKAEPVISMRESYLRWFSHNPDIRHSDPKSFVDGELMRYAVLADDVARRGPVREQIYESLPRDGSVAGFVRQALGV